jgi:putative DNA-binding protein
LDASKLTAPSLVELQRWLRWILTDPRGVGAALSLESGAVEDSWIEPEPLPRQLPAVVGTPLASNADRIGIYASGYFWRLFEALAADFPSVQQALGPEAFQGLVAEYLVKHPSRSPNLADLGSALPGFVHEHVLQSELPFLPDLASLEWSVHLALLSPRARFSGLPTEERHDWGSLRLRLDPTVRLFTTEWAVAPFWEHPRQEARIRPAATRPAMAPGLPRRNLGSRPSARSTPVVCLAPSAARMSSGVGLRAARRRSPAERELRSERGLVPGLDGQRADRRDRAGGLIFILVAVTLWS